jgi:acetyltransferase-like isoleucine patch superfamily enzyme
MREDRRPYWIKKTYLKFRCWYANHYLRPACDYLGEHHTIMKPWYVSISGPNIEIGKCATIIGEPDKRVTIAVWGREPGLGSIKIGNYALISPGVRISASDDIVIGDSVMIANGAYITDADWHGIYDRAHRNEGITPVKIGNNVWLGDHCAILKGVTIGDNSIVAANAVVTKSVEANVIVAGNPARVVKNLDTDRKMITRADFFAEPEKQEAFFDGIDKYTLSKNGLLNWLRTLIFPTRQD